jgi:hypothetical protein
LLSLTAQLLGQIAKPIEKIAIHQFDELRLVLRVDFKSRGPFNIGSVAIGDRKDPQRGKMVSNGNW